MGAFQSVQEEDNYHDLASNTGFSVEQIGTLHRRFKHLSGNKDTLRKNDLNAVTDLMLNPIQSQIVDAFFDRRNFKSNECGSVPEIKFDEFLKVMSHFRPLDPDATVEQRETMRQDKLRFLFNMYDTDNDGMISLEEYRNVVGDLLSRSGDISKEAAKEIADAAMLEVATIAVVHMEPDEFYEGITFDHFVKIWKGTEIETQMHIRFPNMDTTTMCK